MESDRKSNCRHSTGPLLCSRQPPLCPSTICPVAVTLSSLQPGAWEPAALCVARRKPTSSPTTHLRVSCLWSAPAAFGHVKGITAPRVVSARMPVRFFPVTGVDESANEVEAGLHPVVIFINGSGYGSNKAPGSRAAAPVLSPATGLMAYSNASGVSASTARFNATELRVRLTSSSPSFSHQ